MKALLKQQASPYTKVELEQLGAHIAQVTRDNEKETSDYFKEKHQELYQAQVENTEELVSTSEKEFSKLLKYTVEKQEMQALIPELKTRLDFRKLQLVDLYLLLFESADTGLQQEAYENLKANVQDAASIISMATAQQMDWDSFDYVDMHHSQTAQFHTWLEVKINGNILTTVHPSEHQRKQPARHQACLMWIEAYIQNALVSPEQRVEPPAPELLPVVEPESKPTELKLTKGSEPQQMHRYLTKPLKDGQNFVGMLNDLCQRLRWQAPEYDFTEEPVQIFCCECQLQTLRDSMTGKGIAKAKQKAKAAAARDVLEQITQQKWGEWSAGE